MKKAVAIICVCFILLTLCSCTNTEVFGSGGFSGYVKLGDYKNITVDKKTEEYKDYFQKIHFSNIAKINCYNQVEDGKVAYGDVANIDYIGKIDGNAFDGGTDNAYNLTIGSGKFIEGFEEGLIGVSVGETVDLNLTFPDSYDNNDLAGRDCVFTVKVNYRCVPKTPEESYKELGYDSLEKYTESVDEECIENFVTKEFVKTCEFKENPDKEKFSAIVILNYYDSLCRSSYGSGLKEYLEGNNSDMNSFAGGIVDNLADNAFDTLDEIKSVKNALIGYYALFYEEGLSYDESKLGDATGYERCYNESVLVKEAVMKYLKKNAKIAG